MHAFPPVIFRPDERPVVRRGGDISTIPLVTRACGSTGLINGITVIGPGAAIPLHFHNCEESVMVLDGEATVEIDGEFYHMAAGDTTWVPSDLPHRFINASDTTTLRIFWTYARIDATRTNAATGETRTIDDEQASAGAA